MERRFDNNDSDNSFSRREGSDRFGARREGGRESRPRISRDGSSYGSRPRINSEDGESRPRFNREGGYTPRPRYNSGEGDSPRPRFNREDGDSPRPRFNREDGDSPRPRFNRDGGSSYSPRPRYNSDGESSPRPRYNRDGGNGGYSPRPRYNGDGESSPRPRFNREQSEGGYNPRPRYNNGDGDRRPRFDREDGDGERRPRFNREGGNSFGGGSRSGFGRDGGNRGGNRGGNNRFSNDRRNNGGNRGGRGGYGESQPRFNRNATNGQYTEERSQRSSISDDLFVEGESVAAVPAPEALPSTTKMRLNRYIAMAGVCSRREADELIKNGQIKVNGEVITEMGVTVQKDDVVEFEGRTLQAERKVYVLLNKPKDTVTTTDDPEERRTVMDLVNDACEERIYPVGRLDRNTTGVLLLTNDGEMTEHLMHPRYGVRKIYHVFLDKHVTEEDMRKMVDGIQLEDGPISVDDVRFVDANDKKQVGVQIHSGRNRIVRRIFEHLGYDVEKLDRVYFAGLTKLNLPRGRWRFLTDAEISKLKAGFYK